MQRTSNWRQAFILTALGACLLATPAVGTAAEKPNFVLCMADDQGYGDVGYYGNPIPKTPTLDAMAAAGLRLDRFYAAAPVCSPTRGSVMTGRHPNRFACFNWGHTLRPQEITVAEALRKAGYATGHFGKWHLGSVRPDSPVSPGASGFDTWLSSPNFYENDPLMSQNGKVVQTQGESSRVAVDAALEFIDKAVSDKKPFLAVVWFGNPHTPHQPPERLRQLYPDLPAKEQNYYAEITGIDEAMKHLREQLRQRGVAENTIVWYTSDNGPQGGGGGIGSAGPLSGRKSSLLEGGIREPTIVEWPRQITKPRTSDVPCGTVDIYPTLLDLAGVSMPGQPPLDGVSLAPLFRDQPQLRPLPLAFWVYPAAGRPINSGRLLQAMANEAAGQKVETPYGNDADAAELGGPYPYDPIPGDAALIDGDYKLHQIAGKEGQFQYKLFNVRLDPQEKTDLHEQEPETAARLQKALAAWQKSVLDSLNGKDY
ncbi:MraY-like glycosyltransferase [Lignipirellula cremea]|uniref:MraY-like glycosyltransferase n=2 Tax=Lignipirellula cremea TaxID=2528010 RepID=A0A518DY08_9BACT|nr:MraY-like glycosyltransferase [Lignipirellula cremea]